MLSFLSNEFGPPLQLGGVQNASIGLALRFLATGLLGFGASLRFLGLIGYGIRRGFDLPVSLLLLLSIHLRTHGGKNFRV